MVVEEKEVGAEETAFVEGMSFGVTACDAVVTASSSAVTEWVFVVTETVSEENVHAAEATWTRFVWWETGIS